MSASISTTSSTIAPTAVAARAEGVSKFYGTGDATVAALKDVHVTVQAGEFTAIMGPSGSGKSTLLHMLAGLDRPTSGEVFLGDTQISALNDKALTLLRRDRIGFVFQSFNLLPTMTAAENIVLPIRIAGRKPDEAWVRSIVDKLGLADRLTHRQAVKELGQTVVMVTHDPTAASYADRVLFLADGHVVDEMFEPTADAVLDFMKHLGG
jgi:putative ABC transport system ATP-binding protein